MAELRKYGVATTILFPLIKRDTADLSTAATFAAGEVQISKDEGAFANTTNLPVHEGNGIYSLALTATEMEAARIAVTIIDATSPKVWEDQAVIIDAAAVYQAKVFLTDDDTGARDRYVVIFYRDGELITAGITSPDLWVYKAVDATDLIGTSAAPQALTQIGTTGTYRHDEATNRIVDGATYIARVRATVAGATQEWRWPIGRDS